MTELDETGKTLLCLLVQHFPEFKPGRPDTYLGYRKVHTLLGLKQLRETWGESLKAQGLSNLADWTEARGLPAITGLIVSGETYMPGMGYFHLFGMSEPDFDWWEREIRKSLIYDWSRYIGVEAETKAEKPLVASDIGDPPDRIETTIYRILRDSKLAKRVKELHDYKCQICGNTIELGDGKYYAEAHHIRPLGKPHSGPDVLSNLICVCPNHHAELDFAARVLNMNDLATKEGHRIAREFIDYHNDVIVASQGQL